ncbi:MAG: hypothetical protein B7Z31_01015 [Rhodobacterales bacterium 12-65-15]|nr:MAG: hypothetical protein B7Z31_01015 [Rhodobacterales bacterium 12-65-15]
MTGRQLRRARAVAQMHGIEARSDLDAVLQLRRIGVDPFSRASMLEVVSASGSRHEPGDGSHSMEGFPPVPAANAASRRPEGTDPAGQSATDQTAEPGRALVRLPGDQAQLPARSRPISLPAPEIRQDTGQAAEILRMQQDIARRRRRKLSLLFARLFAFVMLPTLFAGWYYYKIATPIYSVNTEFIIEQASSSGGGGGGGGLSGLLAGTGRATSQDSITVQGYLQSLDAMLRLDQDVGFRAHFQSQTFDPLQRLAPDASMAATYRVYKDFVKISYDPNEGLIRMEVMAADPDTAALWAEHLVDYAEQEVDSLTQRSRASQMTDAETRYEEAQGQLADSQRRLIDLQEKFNTISSETEVGLVTSQIATLEGQLTQERLSLSEMQLNPNPNEARMEPLISRIASLEAEIASLRAKLTEGEEGALSMAQVQGELMVAQADLETRQILLTHALQSVENARAEASRQVRFLSVSVRPTAPDEPSYPRAFENTLVTMLILLAIYLMISMTAAILREQVSA